MLIFTVQPVSNAGEHKSVFLSDIMEESLTKSTKKISKNVEISIIMSLEEKTVPNFPSP
jgi:hypothetical protein